MWRVWGWSSDRKVKAKPNTVGFGLYKPMKSVSLFLTLQIKKPLHTWLYFIHLSTFQVVDLYLVTPYLNWIKPWIYIISPWFSDRKSSSNGNFLNRKQIGYEVTAAGLCYHWLTDLGGWLTNRALHCVLVQEVQRNSYPFCLYHFCLSLV